MKIRYALALASLLLMPAVHAADSSAMDPLGKTNTMMPPPPAGNAHGMMQADSPMDKPGMQMDLNLTEEQKKKVQAIHEDARKKHDALREETHQKVLSVLTPEQAKKLEAYRAEMMGRRAEKMQKRADKMKGQAKEPAKTN